MITIFETLASYPWQLPADFPVYIERFILPTFAEVNWAEKAVDLTIALLAAGGASYVVTNSITQSIRQSTTTIQSTIDESTTQIVNGATCRYDPGGGSTGPLRVERKPRHR